MSDYTASIRRIGVINSGMFDTLTLNFDVQAIHLVGANNVGKTSLIAACRRPNSSLPLNGRLRWQLCRLVQPCPSQLNIL